LVLRDFLFAGFAFLGFGDIVPVGVLGGGASTASFALAFREGEEVGREGGNGCLFDEAGFEDGAAFLDEEAFLFLFLFLFLFVGGGGGGGGGMLGGGGGGVGGRGGGRGGRRGRAKFVFQGGELSI
jgi:hypothetical protein